MKRVHSLLLAAGLGVVALPAAAAIEVVETYNLPAPGSTVETVTTRYVTPSTRTHYYYEPARVTTYHYTSQSPAIIVEAPARSVDQQITEDVVDRIASNPKISGRVGVWTHDGNVELTGRVTNPRQAELAERDARSVDGVRDVHNELRTALSR